MGSSLRQLVSRRRTFSIGRSHKPQFSRSNLVQDSVLYSYFPISKCFRDYPDFAPRPFVPNHFNYFISRSFSSGDSSSIEEDVQGPTPIDYRSTLEEDQYQKLANSTIHDLLEKLEEYGDSVDIDGYDIDYGNEVLTVKLGDLGTYVINKQTPNRQIWMSSPVSGPSRYDWDQNAEAWIYRRTKANLLKVLGSELEQLCGQPINLS